MVEWTRRLRMGLANSSPGALGATARPNYVGPSGNGLVERMNAGRKPFGIKGVREWAPLSVSRRRSRGLRKTPQWSAARRTPYVTGRAPQGDQMLPRAFRRSAPSRLRELPLMSEGMEMPGAPRALREQGRRSFG